MFRTIVAVVALLAVAGGVALWAYLRSDDGAEAQAQLIRWVDITVELPEDSGLIVTRDFWGERPRTPAIIIRPLDRVENGVVVGAETGAILHDRVQPEDRAAIDAVLKTVKVSPLDHSTAPWPYSGGPPNVAREEIGNISYIPPDLAAGIRITSGWGDPGGQFIEINNGRSVFGINPVTGEVYEEPGRILPEDREALDRFLSAVDRVER
jgi:hypothetical protein